MEWSLLLLIVAAIGVTALSVTTIGWQRLRGYLQSRETERGVRLFRLQREQLEAKFFDLARSRGRPRGLRWLECEWRDRVTFGRASDTGLLTAFVAVNVRFEAIEGGEMEDIEAVSAVRDATALFHYHRRGQWGTGGRALFNMDPDDALDRLDGQFKPVIVKH